MRRIPRRPSPAMVVACLALAVALSGTSYAVSKLPPNSVGTAQLKKNAVTSAKVKNRTLLATDFALGQIPAGLPGAPGAKGDKGDKGDKGNAGATNVVVRNATGIPAPPGAYSAVSQVCLAGETRVAGGVGWNATGSARPYVVASYPSGAGWTVVLTNDGGSGTVAARAYVLCASP